LVVDEASMVDFMLMQALTKAIPDRAALLIVGDMDQLLSVGPRQVLADVIDSGAVPVVRLAEAVRNASGRARWSNLCELLAPALGGVRQNKL
jgi:exodeoxyribonuclease V alpha subunit